MKNLLLTIENMRDAIHKFGNERGFSQQCVSHVANDTHNVVNLIDTYYNDERFTYYIDENMTTQTESMLRFLNKYDDCEMCGFSENFHVVNDEINE